ncbi:MAG: hypothetical protein M1838_000537 [Thelocarpon superellum]|nr:MAG: hypothetical protein M1838_000537 [Thelocarpon superellum]
MVGAREVELYRRTGHGRTLTAQERVRLVTPYLPSRDAKKPPETRREGTVQLSTSFLRSQLYLFVYTVIHLFFSIYIHLRQAYHALGDRALSVLYYHHRTPALIERDVRGLSRLPNHLSVVLELEDRRDGGRGLSGLVDDLSEIAAWCACAKIPILSVYERTGALKSHIPATHQAVASKMHAYFGRARPTLQVRAPHMPAFTKDDPANQSPPPSSTPRSHLSLLLLSSEDSRDSLVDLTKTLTEMCQRSKLSMSDITPDLIDTEVSESVMGEPDLLVLFGSTLVLQGYPPWQIRLTEIFHVPDNQGVGYQVFLRALHRYAKVQMRFGR